MEKWRVEAGGITRGDHYIVGLDGHWRLTGNTQESHWLADYLNALESQRAELVAALEALREELTDGVCCDACHTDRGHISDCPVPVAERILARARGEPAGTKEEGR